MPFSTCGRRAGQSRADFDRTLRIGRLQVLGRFGLAREVEPGVWHLSDRFEPALRELGERADIIKSINRSLAARGEARSAESILLHGGATSVPVVGPRARDLGDSSKSSFGYTATRREERSAARWIQRSSPGPLQITARTCIPAAIKMQKKAEICRTHTCASVVDTHTARNFADVIAIGSCGRCPAFSCSRLPSHDPVGRDQAPHHRWRIQDRAPVQGVRCLGLRYIDSMPSRCRCS